jgi:hypothetical protein
MASSKWQDLRAALVTAITARLTTQSITGVIVTAFPPLGDAAISDRVYMGRIRVTQEPLTMGGTGRQVGEDIEVDVFVEAPHRGGDNDDLTTAESRAETIFSAVENALRTDSDVNNTLMFAEVTSFEIVPNVTAEWVGVTVEAVITGQSNI